MTSTDLNLLAPLDTSLPPVPAGEVLTKSQWATLLAIADTIIPAIEAHPSSSIDKLVIPTSEYTTALHSVRNEATTNAGRDAVESYFGEKGSSVPGFQQSLQRTFSHYIREDALKGIRVILSALE